MRILSVGIVQMSCVGEKSANIQKASVAIRKAAAAGAKIVCLQELFSTLYFCDTEAYANFSLAEPMPGPTTEHMAALARELGVVIIVPMYEKRAPGVYFNSVAVIDADGTYVDKYRKMHIPDDPGFYEKFYFSPGDIGYKVFQTKYGKIGVLICWDQWYPEAARITALMGAEILFYPTAIGWAFSQEEATNRAQYDAWQTIQRSHAIANGIPVVAVNRVGDESGVRFWGGSFASSAFGEITFLASHDREQTEVLEINMEESDHYRTHWPFLRDRRVESYGPINQRFIGD